MVERITPTLAGQRFCITGELSVERGEMRERLEAAGAKVTASISGKTNYLLVGESPGPSKLKKAQELGTQAIDEEAVWHLLGGAPPSDVEPLLIAGYTPLAVAAGGLPTIDSAVYAVVDLETTGFSRRDRVVEIAIVQVRADGTVLDEYSTLINPECAVTASQVHGITTRAVRNAPTFAEAAGDILARLAGSVFVAHNVSFDTRFVTAEFGRLPVQLPDLPDLCTMSLATRLGLHPEGSKKLNACCEFMGVPLDQHHAALPDSRATALLLTRYLEVAEQRGLDTLPKLGVNAILPAGQWPSLPLSGKVKLRRGLSLRVPTAPLPQESATATTSHFPVAPPALVPSAASPAQAPPEVDHEDYGEYLALLFLVLEDGILTHEEAQQLAQSAQHLGMGLEQLEALHREFLEALVETAFDDEELTFTEATGLMHIGAILGLDSSQVQDLVLTRAEEGVGPAPAQPRESADRPAAKPQAKFCTGCGAPRRFGGARFCDRCGHAF